MYSEGADVAPGNFLDPDAAVPSHCPASWGSSMARVSVGTDVLDGAAHLRHVLMRPAPAGFYTTVQTVLETSSVVEGGVTVAAAKPSGDPKGPVACWRLYYFTYGGRTFFLLGVGNFAKIHVYPPAGSIEPGRNYVHWIAYDLSRGLTGWAVNGNIVFLDAIAQGYPNDIGTLVLGSSGSATARGIVYAVDNYAVLDAR